MLLAAQRCAVPAKTGPSMEDQELFAGPGQVLRQGLSFVPPACHARRVAIRPPGSSVVWPRADLVADGRSPRLPPCPDRVPPRHAPSSSPRASPAGRPSRPSLPTRHGWRGPSRASARRRADPAGRGRRGPDGSIDVRRRGDTERHAPAANVDVGGSVGRQHRRRVGPAGPVGDLDHPLDPAVEDQAQLRPGVQPPAAGPRVGIAEGPGGGPRAPGRPGRQRWR